MVSSDQRYAKKSAKASGKRMAYVEVGNGDPIVFIHGNPTSSYLWRNIIPYLMEQGRCIAPDLIGMGDSDKLDDVSADSYGFIEHRDYLDELLDALGVRENVVFVVHDWGSALGFDWANRNRAATQGVAYMEAIVTPLTWEDWPEPARRIFEGLRSDAGEERILEKNVFVERILTGSILRGLTDEEMQVYRKPFTSPGESRRPTLTWPRQIPLPGGPQEVIDIVNSYAEWLCKTELPKLLISADPGSILTGRQLEFCRSWPNQDEVTVKGLHFIQEDSPHEIGKAVSDFVRKLRG